MADSVRRLSGEGHDGIGRDAMMAILIAAKR